VQMDEIMRLIAKLLPQATHPQMATSTDAVMTV